MNHPYDLVIRNGTVHDGQGGDPFEADVAISGGTIAAIGPNLGRGQQEIDARHRLVTPGFIDPHTHYDAQITWSDRLNPSSWNGVTTVMVGNCGVGFAPCKSHQRGQLIELMEGVEDIPEPVLTEGIPWNWESFGDFMDFLEPRPFDIDVATQVPHAALRVYVMGERGVAREDATEEDRQAMAMLAAEGIKAGALGFSTSRTINHRTVAGAYTPTLGAAEQELIAIGEAIHATKSGWMQVITDFDDPAQEMAMLKRLAKISGRPMSITVLQRDDRPELWRDTMAEIDKANEEGAAIIGQVLPRPTGVMMGFEISLNPFMACDVWREIAHLPHTQKVERLRDPEYRARLLAAPQEETPLLTRAVRWDRIFPIGDPPDYEPGPEKSVAARAEREGRAPADVAYDMLLENEGKTILYRPLSNYSYGNLDTVGDMMQQPHSLVGLGDGGAHVGILTDASAMTYLLSHWTRDRTRGATLPLSWAIKRLTSDNAKALGLNDRGTLGVGRKADINVIDYDAVNICPPEVMYDLPAGGKRMVQRTKGFDATIVSGAITYQDGEATGALPGRLIRGHKSAG